MSKTTKIVIGVFGAIALAAGGYYWYQHEKTCDCKTKTA
jgi:hypothetical protein